MFYLFESLELDEVLLAWKDLQEYSTICENITKHLHTM